MQHGVSPKAAFSTRKALAVVLSALQFQSTGWGGGPLRPVAPKAVVSTPAPRFAPAGAGVLASEILAAHLNRLARARERALSSVFVFHQAPDLRNPEPPPPPSRPAALTPPEPVAPPARLQSARQYRGQPVRGLALTAVLDDLVDRGRITSDQRAELTSAVGDGRVSLSVMVDENTGDAVIQVSSRLANGDRVSFRVTDPVAEGTKAVVSPVEFRADPRRKAAEQRQVRVAENAEMRIARQGFVVVNGERVAVRWDNANRQLVPAGPATVRVNVREAANGDQPGPNQGTIDVDVHHFEVQKDGQIVAVGAGQLQRGQSFHDGQVGGKDGGTGGATPPRAGGGAISHNLDVYVNENDGRISFVAREDGAEVAVSATVGQVDRQGRQNPGVTAEMDGNGFQVVTAGSHDVHVRLTDGNGGVGAVVASAADARPVQGAGGSRFRFTDWTIGAGMETLDIGGQNVLQHFNVSRDSAILVNDRGQAVGNVAFKPDPAGGPAAGPRTPAQIVLNTSPAGQRAAADLFFNNRPSFQAGGANAGIEVGIAGERGRAVVFLQPGSNESQRSVMRTLGRLDGLAFRGADRAQVDARMSEILGGKTGISRYEVTTTMQVGEAIHEVRLLGGGARDDGSIPLVHVLSADQGIMRAMNVEREVETLGVLGVAVEGTVERTDITFLTDPDTGETRFNKDGVIRFKNADGGYAGQVEIRNGKVGEVTVTAGAAGANVNFNRPGEAAAFQTLTLPANRTVTLNPASGAINAESLVGARLRNNDHGLTVRFDRAASGAVTPTVVGDFQAFGKTIDASTITAGFENGRVVLTPPAAFDISGDIRMSGATDDTPDATIREASIVRMDFDLYSGALTGTGRTRLGDGQRVFVAGERGGAGGGARQATPEGADTQNVEVIRDGENAVVIGRGGDAYLNVTVTSPGAAGGEMTARASYDTSRAKNVVLGPGVEYNGERVELGSVTLNKTSDDDFTLTSNAANTTLARVDADGEATFRTVIGSAGTTLTYADGQLQNTAALRDVQMHFGDGASVDFLGASPVSDRVAPRVFAPRGGGIDVAGHSLRGGQFTSRFENGHLLLSIRDGVDVRLENVQIAGGEADERVTGATVKTLDYDLTTGRRTMVALSDDLRDTGPLFVVGGGPAPPGGGGGKPVSGDLSAATTNVAAERVRRDDGRVGIEFSADDAGQPARVNLVIAEGEDGTLNAVPRLDADGSSFRVKESRDSLPLEVAGQTLTGGSTVRVHSAGNLDITAGKNFRREAGPEATRESMTATEGSLIPIRNGQFDSAASTGRISRENRLEPVTAPGVTLERGERDDSGRLVSRTEYEDGNVTSESGARYRVGGAETKIRSTDGVTQTAAANTAFTDLGYRMRVTNGGHIDTRVEQRIEAGPDVTVTQAVDHTTTRLTRDGEVVTESPDFTLVARRGGTHTVSINGTDHMFRATDNSSLRLDGSRQGVEGGITGTGDAALVLPVSQARVIAGPGVAVDVTGPAILGWVRGGKEVRENGLSTARGFTFDAVATSGDAGTHSFELNGARYNLVVGAGNAAASQPGIAWNGREVTGARGTVDLRSPKSEARIEGGPDVDVEVTGEAILGSFVNGARVRGNERGFSFIATNRREDGGRAGFQVGGSQYFMQRDGAGPSTLTFDGRRYAGANALLVSSRYNARIGGGPAVSGEVTGDAIIEAFDGVGRRDETKLRNFAYDIRLTQAPDGANNRVQLPDGGLFLFEGASGDRVSFDAAGTPTLSRGDGSRGDVRLITPRDFVLPGLQAGYAQEPLRETDRGVRVQFRGGRELRAATRPMRLRIYSNDAATQGPNVRRENAYRLPNGDVAYLGGGRGHTSFVLVNGAMLDGASVRGNINVFGAATTTAVVGGRSRVEARGKAAFRSGVFRPELSERRREEVTFERNGHVDLGPNGTLTGGAGTTVELIRFDQGYDPSPGGRLNWGSVAYGDNVTLRQVAYDARNPANTTVTEFIREPVGRAGGGYQADARVQMRFSDKGGENLRYVINYNSSNFEDNPAGTGMLVTQNGPRSFVLARASANDPVVWRFNNAGNIRLDNVTYPVVDNKVAYSASAARKLEGVYQDRTLYLLTDQGLMNFNNVQATVEMTGSGADRRSNLVIKALATTYVDRATLDSRGTTVFLPQEIASRQMTVWNGGRQQVTRSEQLIAPPDMRRRENTWRSFDGTVVSFDERGGAHGGKFIGAMVEDGLGGHQLHGLIQADNLFTVQRINKPKASEGSGGSGEDPDKGLRPGQGLVRILSFQDGESDEDGKDVLFQLSGNIQVLRGAVVPFDHAIVQWKGGGRLKVNSLAPGAEITINHRGGTRVMYAGQTIKLDPDGNHELLRTSISTGALYDDGGYSLSVNERGRTVRNYDVYQASDKGFWNNLWQPHKAIGHMFYSMGKSLVDDPVRGLIFAGVLALGVLASIGTFGAGAAVAAGWIFGTVGMGAWAAVPLVAFGAYNISGIATKSYDLIKAGNTSLGLNGWGGVLLDSALQAIPGAFQAGKYLVYGGRTVNAARQAAGLTKVGVYEANQIARAARSIGASRISPAAFKSQVSKMVKDAAAVGIKDAKGFAAAAKATRALASGTGMRGVGKFWTANGAKGQLRELFSDAMQVAAKEGVTDGATAIAFLETAAAMGFTDFKGILATGIQGATGKAADFLSAFRTASAGIAGDAAGAAAGAAGGAAAGTDAARSATRVADGVKAHAGKAGSDLTKAIKADGALTAGEKVAVLAGVLEKQGQGGSFLTLARELDLGGDLGRLFAASGGVTEEGAGRLLQILVRNPNAGEGLVTTLVAKGGEAVSGFARVLNDRTAGNNFVTFAVGLGGREGGAIAAEMFAAGGEATLGFFKNASGSALGALTRATNRMIATPEDGRALMSGLFGGVKAGGEAAGRDLAGFLDNLGGGAETFLTRLSVDGAKQVGSVVKDGNVRSILQNAARSEVQNFAGALNSGGSAAADYFKQAGKAEALAVLRGESTVVAGLFTGLRAGGAKAVERFVILGKNGGAGDLMASFGKLAANGNAGGARVAEVFASGLGKMTDDAFGFVSQQFGVPAARGQFIRMLTIGGESGATNLMRTLANASFAAADLKTVFLSAAAMTDDGLKGLVQAGMNNSNNLRAFVNVIAGAGDSGVAAMAGFFNEGKGIAGRLISDLGGDAVESVARGVVSLAGRADGGAILSTFFVSLAKGGEKGLSAVIGFLNRTPGAGAAFGRTLGNLASPAAARRLAVVARQTAGNRVKNVMQALGLTRSGASAAVRVPARAGSWSKAAKDGFAAATRDLDDAGQKALGDLMGGLSDDGVKALGAIFEKGTSRSALVGVVRQLEGRGVQRLATMLNLAKGRQGVAFFSALKDVGKTNLARILNAVDDTASKSLTGLFAKTTANGADALAGVLSANADATVFYTFLPAADDAFASILNTLDDAGKSALATVFSGLDVNGAAALGKIFAVAKGEVVGALFNGLTLDGARTFAKVLNSLTGDGVKAITAFFGKLEAQGARLFADILNKANAGGLTGLFNSLTRDGAGKFAALLNTADRKVAAGLVGTFSTLTEAGGRNLAKIINAADAKVMGNLKALLSAAGEKGGANFGELLNGLTAEGTDALLAAFKTLDANGAAALGTVLSQLTQVKGLQALVNQLGAMGKGEILSTLMNSLKGAAEIAKVANLINLLNANGGAQLAKMLVSAGDEAVAGLVKALGKQHIEGLAGFLNAAQREGGARLGKMLSSEAMRTGALKILEAGAEAGKGFAQLLDVVDDIGFGRLGNLLAEKGVADILAGAVKEMGKSGQGAALLGSVLNGADDAAFASLKELILGHGKGVGGEALGRLFGVLARRQLDPARVRQVLTEAARLNLSASQKAGALLKSAFANEAGQLTLDQAGQLASAVKDVLATGVRDTKYMQGLFEGLLTGKGIGTEAAKPVVKEVVAQIMAGSSISGAQKSAMKSALRNIYGADDDLAPLIKSTWDEALLFRAGGAVVDFAGTRLNNIGLILDDPHLYHSTMMNSAIGWSFFGGTGIAGLTPFGWEPDVVDQDGVVVKEGGWYLGFRDPVSREAIGFGDAFSIAFGEKAFEKKYIDARIESMKAMFTEGRRLSLFLHALAFQPAAGALSNFATRGALGNAGYAVAGGASLASRGLSVLSRGGLPASSRLASLTASLQRQSASSLFTSGAQKLVAGAGNRLGLNGARLAASKGAHQAIHALNVVALGWESVIPFHLISSVGMAAGAWGGELYADMAGLEGAERAEAVHTFSELGGKAFMFLVPQARFGAQTVGKMLESGALTKRPSLNARTAAESILGANRNAAIVDVLVGGRTVRMTGAEVAQLRGAAMQVKVNAVFQAEAAKGPDVNPNEILVQVHEAMSMDAGPARSQRIAELRGQNSEVRTLDFNDAVMRTTIADTLLPNVNVQEIAEGTAAGELSPVERRQIVTEAKAEVDAMKDADVAVAVALNRTAAIPSAERTRQRIADVESDVGKQPAEALRAELTQSRSGERIEAAAARRAPDHIVNGTRVRSDVPPRNGVRITESLRREARAAFENETIAAVEGPLMERLARAEAGTTFTVPGRWFRANRAFTVTESLKARAQDVVARASAAKKHGPLLENLAGNAAGMQDTVGGAAKALDGMDPAVRDGFGAKGSLNTIQELAAAAKAGSKEAEALQEAVDAGLGTLNAAEFRTVAERVKNDAYAAEDLVLALDVTRMIREVGIKNGATPKDKPFTWGAGQLFALVMSESTHISMAAGAGKTPIIAARALVESLRTGKSASGDVEQSAVMVLAENPASVVNLLGRGGLFDVAAIGKRYGVEVVDMKGELAAVEAGTRRIEDVSRLLTEGTRVGGRTVRRIVFGDYDNLGSSLANHKMTSFTRAYYETTRRIFDEFHRVTTDPVNYVIGENGGRQSTARSREAFPVLRSLEEALTPRAGETRVGVVEEGGRETIRFRDGTEIAVYRSEAEFKAAGDSRAAAYRDASSGEAALNDAGLRIFRGKAGVAQKNGFLNPEEANSFVKGLLTARNEINNETEYVQGALEGERKTGQYRPIQRGLGQRGNQVIEDIAYLMGLNSRRAQLNRAFGFDIAFSEDSGTFDVLFTMRGISRYEFFESLGAAAEPVGASGVGLRVRGFTATSVGYEGFMRLASGAAITEAGAQNSVTRSLQGLDAVRVGSSRAGGSFYQGVVERAGEIAANGNAMRNSETLQPVLDANGRPVTSRNLVVGTEDNVLIDGLVKSFEARGVGERLVSREWVFDTRSNEAVRVPAGVEVKISGSRGEVTGGGGRYRAIRRVIDNETAEEMIQAIVTSYAEKDAIVIANQRGLTGKDFQGRGTVLLADVRITTGELVQNLERLGRTVKDKGRQTREGQEGNRWDASREVFLSSEFLQAQLGGAFARSTAFEPLLARRASGKPAGHDAIEARDTFRTFVDAVKREMAGGKTRDVAVRTVIETWSRAQTGRESSRGLLRLSTEMNLLGRNTQTARTVAHEVFFYRDLGESLNEALRLAGGRPAERAVLEAFEKEFRNTRERTERDADKGQNSVEGLKQLENISDSSRQQSQGLLRSFLARDGARLSREVRQVFEAKLRYLNDAANVKFSEVVAFESANPGANLAFPTAGRGPLSRRSYVEVRASVVRHLLNDLAPSVDGAGKVAPRTVVQVARQLQERGVQTKTAERIMENLRGDRTLAYEEGGAYALTGRGEAWVTAVIAMMDLDDREREAVAAVVDSVGLGGAGRGGAPLTNGDAKLSNAVASVDALAGAELIDFTGSDDRTVNHLLALGAVLAANAEVVGDRRLTREELKDMLTAGIPGYRGTRASLDQADRDLLDQAQSRAGVAALMTWIVGDDAAPSTPALEALRVTARDMTAEQDAAKSHFDRALVPSRTLQAVNALIPHGTIQQAIEKGTAVKDWIMAPWRRGEKLPTIARGAMTAGGVAAAGATLLLGAGALGATGVTALYGAGLLAAAGAVVKASQILGSRGALARASDRVTRLERENVAGLVDQDDAGAGLAVLARLALTRGASLTGTGDVTKAMSILRSLGSDMAGAAWSRLKFTDLAQMAGNALMKTSWWNPTPAVEKKGATDFRTAFSEWLGAAAKTLIEAPAWLKPLVKGAGVAAQLLQTAAWATGASLGALAWPVAAVGVAGMAVMMMDGGATKYLPGFKEKEGETRALAKSIWDLPVLSFIGGLLGARGDSGLFATLLTLSERALEGKAETFDAYEESGDDAFLAMGFSADEVDRIRTNAAAVSSPQAGVAPVEASQAHRNRRRGGVRLIELASRAFDPAKKAAELDYAAAGKALNGVRGEDGRINDGGYESVASPLGMAAWQVEAVDRTIAAESDAARVTPFQVYEAARETAARGAVTEEAAAAFLFRSLGADAATVRANVETLETRASNELLNEPTAVRSMVWAVPRVMSVRSLARPWSASETDGVTFMGRLGAGLMRGWKQRVRVGAASDDSVHRRFLSDFHDSFSAYLHRLAPADQARALTGIRDTLDGDPYQVPSRLGARAGDGTITAADVAYDVEYLHASVVLNDLRESLVRSGQGDRYQELLAAAVARPGTPTVAQTMGALGIPAGDLKGHVHFFVITKPFRDLVRDLGLAPVQPGTPPGSSQGGVPVSPTGPRAPSNPFSPASPATPRGRGPAAPDVNPRSAAAPRSNPVARTANAVPARTGLAETGDETFDALSRGELPESPAGARALLDAAPALFGGAAPASGGPGTVALRRNGDRVTGVFLRGADGRFAGWSVPADSDGAAGMPVREVIPAGDPAEAPLAFFRFDGNAFMRAQRPAAVPSTREAEAPTVDALRGESAAPEDAPAPDRNGGNARVTVATAFLLLAGALWEAPLIAAQGASGGVAPLLSPSLFLGGAGLVLLMLPALASVFNATASALSDGASDAARPRGRNGEAADGSYEVVAGDETLRFRFGPDFGPAERIPARGEARERAFARTLTRGADGAWVIGRGRELRSVTFTDDAASPLPARPTPLLEDLAARLSAIDAPEPSPAAPDAASGAAAAVDDLLASRIFGGWTRRIDVLPLLGNAEQIRAVEAAFGIRILDDRGRPLQPTLALGDLASFNNDGFARYVKALAAFNAEAVSTPAGVLVSGRTYARLNAAGPVLLHHTQPERVRPSLLDRRAFPLVAAAAEAAGSPVPLFPLMVSGPDGVSFFDSAKVLLRFDRDGGLAESAPVAPRAPRGLLGGAPVRRGSLAQRLVNWFRPDAVALSPEEMANAPDFLFAGPEGRALGDAMLSLGDAVRGLPYDAGRRAFFMAAAVAYEPSASEIIYRAVVERDAFGMPSRGGRMDLARMITALGREMSRSGAGMNLALLPDRVHRTVSQYLDVSAMPYRSDGPETEWILAKVSGALDLKLLSPSGARAMASRLDGRSASPDALQETLDQLLILAGMDESDFFDRIDAARRQQGAYAQGGDVRRVLTEGEGTADEMGIALKLLMRPLAGAIADVTGREMDAGLRRRLANAAIEVKRPDELAALGITARQAGIIDNGGQVRIVIGVDPGMNPKEAIARAVGLLGHETAHLLGHDALEAYDGGPLGVPTLLEEAWVAMAISRALRERLKLNAIADVIDLETARNVVKMEARKAYYVRYQDLVAGGPGALTALNAGVDAAGGETQVIVLVDAGDEKAARALIRRGVTVLRADHLARLQPLAGETKLEAHARLFVGTHRVRLLGSRAQLEADDVVKTLIYAAGKGYLWSVLLADVTSDQMAARLPSIMSAAVTARALGTQA